LPLFGPGFVFFVSFVVELFHRDLGGAGRPPLVILPGFLGSSRNWQTAGAGLASRFHVWALDLRNHGQSPAAPEMTFDAMLDDVLGWMDAQNFATATLLGHSMGGKVAMRLACRHPARVARLIAIDIAPKEYPGMAQRAEVAAMNELRLDELHSRAEAELRFEGRVDSRAMRKFLASILERDAEGHWRWTVNLPVLTAALPELVKDPLEANDRFDGPATFILGGKSRFVEAGDHAIIRRHFPAATIRIMPESGHNPHIEAREAFVRLVLAEA
jgi:pimeloyl-ACP methyl ester carboxylesterase